MSRIARLSRPSWGQNFARYASQSAYPNFWKGLVGAWVPALGVTGGTLFDVSGRSNHGILTNMLANDWVTTNQRGVPWALDFTTAADNAVLPAIMGVPGDTFTWLVWFKTNSDGWVVGSNEALDFRVHTSKILLQYFSTGMGSQLNYGDTNVADDIWHLGGITLAGTDVTFWLDGKPDGTGTVEGDKDPLNWMAIADKDATPANVGVDQIASAILWDRILLPAEHADLYANPLGMFTLRRQAQVGTAAAPPAGNPMMYYQQMASGAA